MTVSREIRPVRSFAERCEAWHLVYSQYRRKNYTKAKSSGLLFSLLDLLPHSLTFGYWIDGKLLGTISGVFNSVGGFPFGENFENDLFSHDVDGQIICECTRLACLQSKPTASRQIALALMGTVIDWCYEIGVDRMLCVVHPDHATLWTSTYHWKRISASKSVGHVSGSPGVLLELNLKTLYSKLSLLPRRSRKFLGEASHKSFKGTYRLKSHDATQLLLQHPEMLQTSPLPHQIAFRRFFPRTSALFKQSLYNAPFQFPKLHKFAKPKASEATSSIRGITLGNLLPASICRAKHSSSPSLLIQNSHSLEGFHKSIKEQTFNIIFLDKEFYPEKHELILSLIRRVDIERKQHTPIILAQSSYEPSNVVFLDRHRKGAQVIDDLSLIQLLTQISQLHAQPFG